MRNRKTEILKSNKGISLLEMMIVLAILGVLAGIAIPSVSMITSQNVKKCAKTLDYALTKTRAEDMSQIKAPYLYLYRAGNSYYYQITEKNLNVFETEDGIRLAGSRVKITAKRENGTFQEIVNNSVLKIRFLRSSGAFDTAGAEFYPEIRINGSRGSVRICMVKETGRHEIKELV